MTREYTAEEAVELMKSYISVSHGAIIFHEFGDRKANTIVPLSDYELKRYKILLNHYCSQLITGEYIDLSPMQLNKLARIKKLPI